MLFVGERKGKPVGQRWVMRLEVLNSKDQLRIFYIAQFDTVEL